MRVSGRSLLRESLALLLAGLVGVLALALTTFSPQDPSLNHETARAVTNRAGLVGAYVSDMLYQLVGIASWAVLLLIAAFGARVAFGVRPWFGGWTSLFWLPFLLAFAALLHAHAGGLVPTLPAGPGGAFGAMLADGLKTPLHAVGRDILLLALALSSFVAASHLSLLATLHLLGRLSARLAGHFANLGLLQRRRATARRERMQGRQERRQQRARQEPKLARIRESKPEVATPARVEVSRRAKEEQQGELALGSPEPERNRFRLPSLGLFSPPPKPQRSHSPEAMQAMARMLEKKLLDYRVEGEVVAVQPGPVVTQFEFEPAPGTKVNRIIGLQEDLARAMSAVSVRVAGNIPGKTVIGIEIPNEERETVFMHEVLASKAFSDKRHTLPLALGVDIGGHAVVTDLAKMPHLLVAGTTGSGKSVSINTMICSMLMTYAPEELRLILVDPKMLELSMYEDIPHLLVPVVTNPSKAARALAWAVFEMERRYKLMAEAKVRNLASYNRAIAQQPRGEEGEHLPFIVIIIDELADLMMVAGKEVEQSICRLAQKARAAGIHLVLATQRPSVDVITGLIKANLPSRVAFQVSSRVDSRTILDQMGAEQLLGQGDSLFLSGGRDIRRVHGAFVSDAEVQALVTHLKGQGSPDYREEVFAAPESPDAPSDGGDDYDSKYDEAVQLVVDKGQCSVSMVQRYLRIGYNRASRIVERMEQEGLVTPPASGGARKVLARGEAEGGGVIG